MTVPLLGERRIRVHTLCLPVVSSLADVYAGVDVQAAICLLANMGEWHERAGEIPVSNPKNMGFSTSFFNFRNPSIN